MNKFLWVLGGATLGIAAWVVLTQQVGGAVPADGVDAAAQKMGTWGTKQRFTGTGGQLFGKAEQGVANVTGDEKLGSQGVLDEATGAVKDAAGKAAHAVGGAVQDLNS